MDGWSKTEIINRVLQSYEQLQCGQNLVNCEPQNVFREMVALTHRLPNQKKVWQYWQQLLSEINYKGPRKIETDNLLQKHLLYTATGPENIKAIIQQSASSVKAVYVNALAQAVYQWTNQACNSIGVLTNGRTEHLSDPLQGLGLFWNMLPLVYQPEFDIPLSLTKTHQNLLASEQHGLISLPALQKMKGHPLFFVTLNYMDFHNAEDELETDLQSKSLRGHDKLHYPINFAINPINDGRKINIRVDYDGCYFDTVKVNQLFDLFINQLNLHSCWKL